MKKKETLEIIAPKLVPLHIGDTAVDSAQLLICDPMYIDSSWKEEEFKFSARQFKDVKTGEIMTWGKDFKRFDHILPGKDGKTMNDLLSDGSWEQMPYPDADFPFSYYACCKVRLEKGGGQLNFEAGHPGLGVVTRSGYGDGIYPVYQKFNEEEELVSVEVVFDATLIEHYNDLIHGADDEEVPPIAMTVYTDLDEQEDGSYIVNEEAMREDFEHKLALLKKRFEK